ncbi:hypothetical protein [Nocardioides albus]|uniref:Uncharacterized protein n=1 Tax=Nocardioides albus TaxID=1841 RepID=A0A7W5FAR8_9ACTN|nr:hypothetical protein [Nocardioides albus]MBB3091569.1 hypothetical protein [Nocardioides albus]
MTKAFAATAVAALAVAVAPLISSPAHADTAPLPYIGGYATLTVNNVTKAQNCEEYGVRGTNIPVSVDVSFGANYTDEFTAPTTRWEVAVFDSAGDDVTNYIEGTDFPEGSATGNLCSFLPVGNYRAVAYIFTMDDAGSYTDTAEVTDAFSIRAAHSYTLSAGRSATTIKSQLKDYGKALAGRSVAVQRKSSGTWKTITHRTTGSTGWASASVARGYSYRFTYGGKYSAAVWVPKVATSVAKISVSKYGKTSYRSVGKLTAGGKVVKGKRILLQKRSNGGWVTVKSCVTSAYGKCAAVTAPASSRNYRWKYAGDATRAADVSASFYLRKRG